MPLLVPPIPEHGTVPTIDPSKPHLPTDIIGKITLMVYDPATGEGVETLKSLQLCRDYREVVAPVLWRTLKMPLWVRVEDYGATFEARAGYVRHLVCHDSFLIDRPRLCNPGQLLSLFPHLLTFSCPPPLSQTIQIEHRNVGGRLEKFVAGRVDLPVLLNIIRFPRLRHLEISLTHSTLSGAVKVIALSHRFSRHTITHLDLTLSSNFSPTLFRGQSPLGLLRSIISIFPALVSLKLVVIDYRPFREWTVKRLLRRLAELKGLEMCQIEMYGRVGLGTAEGMRNLFVGNVEELGEEEWEAVRGRDLAGLKGLRIGYSVMKEGRDGERELLTWKFEPIEGKETESLGSMDMDVSSDPIPAEIIPRLPGWRILSAEEADEYVVEAAL